MTSICTQSSDIPPVAEQQVVDDCWLVEDSDPLEIARLVRNIYRDFDLPIAVLKAAIIIERHYHPTAAP